MPIQSTQWQCIQPSAAAAAAAIGCWQCLARALQSIVIDKRSLAVRPLSPTPPPPPSGLSRPCTCIVDHNVQAAGLLLYVLYNSAYLCRAGDIQLQGMDALLLQPGHGRRPPGGRIDTAAMLTEALTQSIPNATLCAASHQNHGWIRHACSLPAVAVVDLCYWCCSCCGCQ
jgi:hypothetical protein